MKITIATGIYPPEIGGPAEYARQLLLALSEKNHKVSVVTYGRLKKFPTGLRHALYFFKLCFRAISSDYIIALDTFSVGLPAVIFAKLFGKKIVIRVAGDFLWESFVERTKQDILLSDFYKFSRDYSVKESLIFLMTRLALRMSSVVVFSTKWQEDIMTIPYKLDGRRNRIVENFYALPETARPKTDGKKVFLSPSRNIHIKNKRNLALAFAKVQKNHPEIVLETNTIPHDFLLEEISGSYAVMVVSFSEVSPNMVFDALRKGVPVIVTKDTGVHDKLKDVAVFADPFSVNDIASSIETLLNPSVYNEYLKKISEMSISHSWDEIAEEFLKIYTNK